ncbi:MAG: hypothetical protein AB1921_04560 [Thermodesulfobacteriota bacterium]
MNRKTILFFACAFLLAAAPALALDNVVAHPSITNTAVDYLISQQPAYSYFGNYNHFNLATDPQLTFIDEGSVKEDYGLSADWDTAVWGSSQDSRISTLSYQNHGYNPKTGDNWDPDLGGVSAYVYAGTVYGYIGSAPNRYFQIGRFCHLMEDMISPAHAHADTHIDGDDFETYGQYHYSNISWAPAKVRKPSTDGLAYDKKLPHPRGMTTNSYQNFIQNVVWRTYYMTSYWGGSLVEIEGDRQPDSELKRMFPYWDGGLRYDDGGWFVNDAYIIDDVGYNWIGYGIGNNPDWWGCTSDSGYFYLENIDGDWSTCDPSAAGNGVAPHVFKVDKFRRVRSGDNLNTVLTPNTDIFSVIYGKNLYPMAAEWIAGFLTFVN